MHCGHTRAPTDRYSCAARRALIAANMSLFAVAARTCFIGGGNPAPLPLLLLPLPISSCGGGRGGGGGGLFGLLLVTLQL
jgi:uncharacterized membrane protein